MVGQKGGNVSLYSDDTATYSRTVQVKNRDTRAEIALYHVNEFGMAFVSQVVSDSGVEMPNHGSVYRKGVTSVTFSLIVSDSGISARYLLHYWS